MLYTGDEAQAKQAYTLVEIRAFQQHIIAGDGVVRTRDGRMKATTSGQEHGMSLYMAGITTV